jgi:hypothetical protein
VTFRAQRDLDDGSLVRRRRRGLQRSLRESGFDGYADIEIVSTPEASWGRPVGEAARRAADAARRLITQS